MHSRKKPSPQTLKPIMKESSNHHTTIIEAAFPVKALAAAGTKSARRAIVIKAAEPEVEKVTEPRKPKASDVFKTNKEIFYSLSPQERRRAMESQSNNITRFLKSIDYEGIELA